MAVKALNAGPSRWATAAAVAAMALFGFLYRYLGHHGFPDDHFIHLARAQQWLTGAWPIYDFSDFGAPLTVGLSALAMGMAPGDELWAEVLFTCAGFGLAAGLIAWAVILLSRSVAWAIFAAALAVVVLPRTYAHPKLWLYPAACLAGLWYLRAPSLARIAALAGLSTFAFLVRHDHGLYIAIPTVVMLAAAHWQDGMRVTATRMLQFVATGLLMVSPFLAYVAASPIGLTGYVRSGLEVNRYEGDRSRLAWPRLRPSLRAAWGLEEQVPDLEINVRWETTLTDVDREAAERALDLQPLRVLEPYTYRYLLPNATVSRQLAVVHHPAVKDTSNIDRSQRLGLRGLLSAYNAQSLLYYTHFALALTVIAMGLRRTPRPNGAVLVLLGAMAFVSGAGLLRDPLAVRMPDVFGTFAIGAGVCLAALGRAAGGRVRARAAAAVVAIVLFAATALVGDIEAQVKATGVTLNPTSPFKQAVSITRQLRRWPWPRQWPAGETRWPLARYVRACTAQGDRLLVTWNSPELFVVTGRPFAGTETVLLPVWREPASYEMPLIRRVLQQAPTMALVSLDGWEEFVEEYPTLAAYIERTYREIGVFHGRPEVSVRALRSRTPSGVDMETGWPCFAGVESNAR